MAGGNLPPAMTPRPTALRLSDLPLWRLLVALDDAERTVGANSPTAQALAREVRKRLRADPVQGDTARQEVGHA